MKETGKEKRKAPKSEPANKRSKPLNAHQLRALILVGTLIVALFAIYWQAYDPVVWTFLSMIASYAALTNHRDESAAKDGTQLQ